ncbi:hypothetical protein ACFL5V_08125 [Fibrobacterota bacterium]
MTIRWLAKKLLRLLPQKPARALKEREISSIAYLFSGTYGDFVQSLDTLKALSEKYPSSIIYLVSPWAFYREFAFLLPENIRPKTFLQMLLFVVSPVDLMFTNVIAVYRVRWEAVSLLCSRVSYGFCYEDEPGRKSFTACYRLKGTYKNFSRLNFNLIALPGRYDGKPLLEEKSFFSSDNRVEEESYAIPDERKILFHIGSATLRKDFGSFTYHGIICSIVDFLIEKEYGLTAVAGDQDKDILRMFMDDYPHVDTRIYSIPGLKEKLENFKGTIICFDSFMAHYCHYLKKPALVINRELVKSGYDCSPLHKHIVLRKSDNWDLSSFFQVF